MILNFNFCFFFLFVFQAELEETIIRQPKQEPLDIPLKKAKLIDEKYLLDYQYQAMILAQYRQAPHSFRPWAQLLPPPPPSVSLVPGATTKHLPHLPYAAAVVAASLPYLSQEPPILQNPERVVRLSECERFEQSYQPNVALKPRNKSINSAAVAAAAAASSSSSLTIAASNAIKEHRERDNSRGRDYECCDADRNVERLQTDSIETVKIKQERPNTPIEDTQSPESRMESSPSGVINPAPISPEGQSGSSNEITSSTSPVPVTASHKQIDTTLHSPKTPPPPIDNHHIHQLLLRSHHHHHSTKPSTDTNQHQSHHTHSSTHIRHSIGLTNGTYSHHKFNGTSSHLNNSEFELSTDTDDDSLAGEADSSNNIAPLEIAVEALKDTKPQERDRVLHIIKMLLHENVQMNLKNNKLLQEIRRKDDEIHDLLQLNRINHKSPIIKTEETTTTTITDSSALNTNRKPSLSPVGKTSTTTTTRVIETANVVIKTEPLSSPTETTNSSQNDTVTAVTAVETKKKSETEVIRMPLKKSARRSPEETVVIMKPHKLRDEAREKMNKVSRYYDQENRSSPSPIHHTSDTSTIVSTAVVAESEAKAANNV